MRNRRARSGLLIRSAYALCLLVATCTHAAPLIQHGLFWDYGGVGWFSAAFWTTLAFADPAAAACLFVWPRVGVVLTSGIIGLDVLHNGIVFSDVLRHPSGLHLWTYTAFGLQLAFLLFVIATVRVPWAQAQEHGPSCGGSLGSDIAPNARAESGRGQSAKPPRADSWAQTPGRGRLDTRGSCRRKRHRPSGV